MLKEIINYISERRSCTADELSVHLKVDKSAIEGMLELLINKEKVEILNSQCHSCKSACGSCNIQKYYKIKNG